MKLKFLENSIVGSAVHPKGAEVDIKNTQHAQNLIANGMAEEVRAKGQGKQTDSIREDALSQLSSKTNAELLEIIQSGVAAGNFQAAPTNATKAQLIEIIMRGWDADRAS